MPRYRFRLSIFERLLDAGNWLELPDRDAAEKKARQIAQALLSVADQRVPWAEGEVVVECSDGSPPIVLRIIDMAVDEIEATWH